MEQGLNDQSSYIDDCGPGFLRFWNGWCDLPKQDYIPNLKDYLDNVDPRLQPGVVIMDFVPPTHMEVRLAGTGIVRVFGEITRATEEDIYQPSIKEQAYKQGVKAASHPCGFTIKRTFKDAIGRRANAFALILPLRTTPDRETVVSYNGFPEFEGEPFDDELIQAIIGFSDLTWIDIGAGVPK